MVALGKYTEDLVEVYVQIEGVEGQSKLPKEPSRVSMKTKYI